MSTNRKLQNDLSRIFQRYRNAVNENNQDEAEALLVQCRDILSGKNGVVPGLKLKELKLYDYKKFEELRIHFEKNLTVLVGVNAAGKTSILDAVIKALTWIKAGLEAEGRNGVSLTDSDIRIGADYSKTCTTFEFDGCDGVYEYCLAKSAPGRADNAKSSLGDVRQLADMYRRVNAAYPIELPIFVYFSVGRTWISSKVDKETTLNIYDRYRAYSDCLSLRTSFYGIFKWFELSYNAAISNTSRAIIDLNAIDLALRNFRLDERGAASGLRMNYSSGRSVVEIQIQEQSEWVDIDLLSDGQKVITGMVIDMVRRMHMLNPAMADPLQGHGIVVIDEIELHLHPAWQQTVLPNLTKTFPNVQFIVTTHSPQVLSTVRRENIRVLYQDQLGSRAIMPDFSPLAHESGDALAKVMGTHREPAMPLQETIREFEQLVRSGRENTDEAQTLRATLDQAGYQIHESDLVTWRFLAARRTDKAG